MATASPDSTILPRENQPALRQSIRHEYDALRHALGLPQIDTLQNIDEPGIEAVIRTLAGNIANVRGALGRINEIQRLLITHFTRELENAALPEGTAADAAEQRGIEIANALLLTVRRNFTDEDFRALIEQLRPAIVPDNGTDAWSPVAGITVGGNAYTLGIDLTHHIWRSGSREEIEQRLRGRTPGEVGVTLTPVAPAPAVGLLTADHVRAILDSRATVLDPSTRLSEVHVPAIPGLAGIHEAVADLRGLFRAVPTVATLNATALAAYFDTSTGAGNYRTYVRCVDQANSPVPNPTPSTPLVAELYRRLGRSTGERLFDSRTLSLTEAMSSRQSIDDLVTGGADRREVLMALSVLQRDPTAIQAVVGGRTQELMEERRKLEAEKNLATALAKLQSLRPITLTAPPRTSAVLLAEIAALEAVPAPAGRGDSGWATSQEKRIQARRDELENLQEALEALGQILAYVQNNPDLQGRLATDLAYLNTFVPGEAAVVEQASGFNGKRLAELVTRQFNTPPATGDSGRSAALKSVSTYEQKLNENTEALENAQKEKKLTGSNACWAVIKRGLENQGVRGRDLESTVSYMKARLQVSPETAGDNQEFVQDAFPDPGQEDSEAAKQWNEGRTFRGVSTLGTQYQALTVYMNNLFTRGSIGIPLNANVERRGDYPLPTLIHAYFRTKYLYNLPSDNQKRLPHSTTITGFLRRLHRAIIERAQESFSQAVAEGGVGMRELEQMRADGLNVDPSKLPAMSITERRQAVHAFLVSDAYYTDVRKSAIESIAAAAYRPVERDIQAHARGVERWKKAGQGVKRVGGWAVGIGHGGNPATWPGRLVKFGLWTVPRTAVIGAAKGVKAVGSGIRKHWAALAGATALTVISGPVGALVGAFVLAKSIRDKRGSAAAPAPV